MTQKSLVIFSSLALVLASAQPIFAQTKAATNSASITPSKAVSLSPTTDADEVDKLKEKVAEKVSKLASGEDKAVAGVVQSIANKELIIKNMDGDMVEVALDDTLTKYYNIAATSTKEVKQTDIAKGDYIFAAGPEIGGQINANGIYLDQRYIVTSGKITEVDADEYTVKIVTLDKNNFVLDIQTRTTQEMLNIKTLELEKVGFSKLKEGDSIHVVMKANLQNDKQTRYDAEKILIIPNEYFLQ